MPIVTEKSCEAVLGKLAFYLERWKRNPLAYVIEAVGDVPTHQQAEILKAIPVRRFVSVRSGHGIGKSKLAGWLVNWYLDCHRQPGGDVMCRVPCTSGSASQLADVLWPEVAAVCKKKLPWLRDRYEVLSDRMRCKEDPEGWFATLRTSRRENPDALQGFHQCFFLIDEGSAVPDEVFEVARGAMGDPGSYGLMTGNPTRLSGYFHRVHHSDTCWHAMHFSSEDSLAEETYRYDYTDVLGDIRTVETHGRQTRQWVEEMKREFGEHSNTYKIRVKGEFANLGADLIVEPPWVDRLWALPLHEPLAKRRRIMGVDVARSGDDDSALVIREGDNVLYVEKWHGCDLVETRQRVEARQKEWRCDVVYVDIIGIGAGVYDELRHKGYPVRPATVSEKAPEDSDADCVLLRDWLWWKARRFFRTHQVRFAGQESDPLWKQLRDELIAPTYKFDTKGKVKAEGKDDLKKRGVKSPNLADALNMTFLAGFEQRGPKRRKGGQGRRKKKRGGSWKTA